MPEEGKAQELLRRHRLPRRLVPDFIYKAIEKLLEHGEDEAAESLAAGYARMLRYMEGLEELCHGAVAEPSARPFMGQPPGLQEPLYPRSI